MSRKLVVKEIYDVMFKVSELCVTSDDEHVRGNARQVIKSEREDMKESRI